MVMKVKEISSLEQEQSKKSTKVSTQDTAESLGEIPSEDESSINLPEKGEKFFRGGKSHKFGTSIPSTNTSFVRPTHARFHSVNLQSNVFTFN